MVIKRPFNEPQKFWMRDFDRRMMMPQERVNSNKKGLICIISACAYLAPMAEAIAQTTQQHDGWQVSIGAGTLLAPSYLGDDDYQLRVMPNIHIKYGDRFFASIHEGIGINVLSTEKFRVGPIARVAFARNEDGDQPFIISGNDTSDLIGLGDVNTTVELGGFAQVDFGPLTISAEARHGANGHAGFVADFGVRTNGRLMLGDQPVLYSMGPRARLVGDDYNSAYFSVDDTQSTASGLPTFDARGGLQSYGFGGAAIFPISRDAPWAFVFNAGYDRITGDAGDAPLISVRGSRNQAKVGLSLIYRLY